LLVAERVIDKAAEQLKGCALRIVIVHHPIDWLSLWSQKAIRVPLFANFDLVLFGHVHEAFPTLTENTIGQCVLAQGGCLYQHRDFYNGYQLIDVTANDGFEFAFHLRTWFNEPRRAFAAAENICARGEMTLRPSSDKTLPQQLKVEDQFAIQTRLDEVANARARTLLLSSTLTFDEAFTCPPLSNKSPEELVRLTPTAYKHSLIQLADIITNDGVIVFCGARESGKTTLALKIAKQLMQLPGKPLKQPILVDFLKVKNYDTLDRLVRRHFSTLNVDASRVLSGHRCFFIVDNVSLADLDKLERLKQLIAANRSQHDWCIFLDSVEFVSRKTILEEFGATTPYLHSTVW